MTVTGAPAAPLGFPERTRALLAEAITAYQGRPGQRRLLAVAGHLDEPLRVAIAGRVKAGKSTLLNALVGQRIAATDAGECTRIVTWYVHGGQARAVACPRTGEARPVPLVADAGGTRIDLSGLHPDDLTQLRVELPNRWLARMTLIDTPGMGSLSEAVSQRTHDFLADASQPVDAVLYLLRQLHSSDVDFLEAFHEAQSGQAAAVTSPVNAVGVLSRADEVGGGAPDAMRHARQVAADYRTDPRIRALVHTVVPVAGLLAEAGTALGPAMFADLTALAGLSESTVEQMLLSTNRFLTREPAVLARENRQRLLRQLGMYGVRLSLRLIWRNGAALDGGRLSRELMRHSGLSDLRRLLLSQFGQRRDVLKAETALRVIDAVAAAEEHPAGQRLREQVERLRANAHELAEIRLLTELRTGQVPGSLEVLASIERLLGGQGVSITTRLGLTEEDTTGDLAAGPPGGDLAAGQPGRDETGDGTRDEVGDALRQAHDRWRRVAQSPLTDPALARAAAVALRTCEGLAAARRLGGAASPAS